MKKIITIIALVMFAAFAQASTITSIDVGVVSQKGSNPELMYAVGFDVPIVQKDSAGFALIFEPTYLYSDKEFSSSVKEVQGIRAFLLTTKNFEFIHKNLKPLYLGIGTGTWTVSNTSGKDEMLGAYKLLFGWQITGFKVTAGTDFIPIAAGADMYFPHLSVSIKL